MKPKMVNFVRVYDYMIVFVDGKTFFEGDCDELDVCNLLETVGVSAELEFLSHDEWENFQKNRLTPCRHHRFNHETYKELQEDLEQAANKKKAQQAQQLRAEAQKLLQQAEKLEKN